MKRETKLNYGLLFVGLALPIIAEYFLGRAVGVIVAIVVLVIGCLLLISGHTHREEGEPLSRKRQLAAFAVIGALLALGLIGIRAVSAKEFARHQGPDATPSAKETNEAQSHNTQPKVDTAAPNTGRRTSPQSSSELDGHSAKKHDPKKVRSKSASENKTAGEAAKPAAQVQPTPSQQQPPMSMECAPGAKCAQSSGQSGGINQLNVIGMDYVPIKLTARQDGNKIIITTNRRIDSLSLVLFFDAEITGWDISAQCSQRCIEGARRNDSSGKADLKTIWTGWGVAFPTLTPDHPLEIHFSASGPAKLTRLEWNDSPPSL